MLGLFACSGPGAGAAIAGNERLATALGAGSVSFIGLSLALLYWSGAGRWLTAAVAALALLHPAWTISARGGDCGILKADGACLFSGVGAVLLAAQGLLVLRTRARRRASVVLVE